MYARTHEVGDTFVTIDLSSTPLRIHLRTSLLNGAAV
jgi:hypothetical protein